MIKDDATPQEVLDALDNLKERFYWMCFREGLGTHAHAFLEFNGVMGEYLNLLRDAVAAGHSINEISVHSGNTFPAPGYRMRYLGEKLSCIFAPFIDNNPQAREILSRALFGETTWTKDASSPAGGSSSD